MAMRSLSLRVRAWGCWEGARAQRNSSYQLNSSRRTICRPRRRSGRCRDDAHGTRSGPRPRLPHGRPREAAPETFALADGGKFQKIPCAPLRGRAGEARPLRAQQLRARPYPRALTLSLALRWRPSRRPRSQRSESACCGRGRRAGRQARGAGHRVRGAAVRHALWGPEGGGCCGCCKEVAKGKGARLRPRARCRGGGGRGRQRGRGRGGGGHGGLGLAGAVLLCDEGAMTMMMMMMMMTRRRRRRLPQPRRRWQATSALALPQQQRHHPASTCLRCRQCPPPREGGSLCLQGGCPSPSRCPPGFQGQGSRCACPCCSRSCPAPAPLLPPLPQRPPRARQHLQQLLPLQQPSLLLPYSSRPCSCPCCTCRRCRRSPKSFQGEACRCCCCCRPCHCCSRSCLRHPARLPRARQQQ